MLRHVTRRIVEVFLIRIRQGTGYDALKRLTNATTAAWTQTIGYDGFGNITSKTVPPTSAEPAFPGAVSSKNWLGGVSYDLNGNALGVNAFELQYDVENRLATATSGSAVESYLYDESNHRVEKTIGSADYFYFYGPGGRLLTILQLWAGTTSLVADRVYFGGLLLGSAGSWVSADVSTMTDRLGTAESGYPYGTDIGSTSASNDQPDFATYTKDATTGFEYANQRYYSAGLGRFLTADGDLASVHAGSPETWNRYAYVNGDSTNLFDPLGACPVDTDYSVNVCAEPDFFGSDFQLVIGQPSTPAARPAAGDLDDQINNKELPNAIKRALKWLSKKDKDCLNFLGANGTVDPIAILNSLNAAGDINAGYLPSPANTVLSAITAVTGTSTVPISGGNQIQNTSVSITLNDVQGSFVDGGTNSQATTLLHELGHAIFDLYGPQGSNILPPGYGIQPDGSNVPLSENNAKAIQEHCH